VIHKSMSLTYEPAARVLPSLSSDGASSPSNPSSDDVRLIDCCITELKAQGPSRTCDESKEEEVTVLHTPGAGEISLSLLFNPPLASSSLLLSSLELSDTTIYYEP